jgi:hypothetical protein
MKGITMTMRQLLLPGCGSATLTLADPVTHEMIAQLQAGLDTLLLTLRHELRGNQPDPGDLELQSWSAHLHPFAATTGSHLHA